MANFCWEWSMIRQEEKGSGFLFVALVTNLPGWLHAETYIKKEIVKSLNNVSTLRESLPVLR